MSGDPDREAEQEGLGKREDESRRRPPSAVSLALRSLAIALVFGLLALLAVRVVERGRGSHLVADVRTGKDPPAPLFELEVIWPHTETWPAALRPLGAREQIRLRDLRGYPVVLNFWASWCVPCAKEAPRLVSSARAHRGKVIFLGVDVQDFSSDARRFLRRHQVDYVSVRSRSSAVYDAYGLTGLPETYYLDRRGRIVDHYPGELSRRQLEDSIATIARAGS